MSHDTSYDQDGQFFPIFFVTVSALVVIPVTVSALRKGKELENTASPIESDFRPQHASIIDNLLRLQKKQERKLKRAVLAIAGWIFIALNIYWIVTTQRFSEKPYDPYELLGISTGATEKEIKSRYRKLSTTLHPDKARPNAAKNETEESINTRWVDIVKAYKSLTDEDTRRNYELYGHPDGKQSTTFGIALPQFLIAEGNGKYVLLVYGALLGIVLPYFVARWWYGSQKVTREGTLISSVGKLFREYRDRIDRHGVLYALRVGDEHSETFKSDREEADLAHVEKLITAGPLLSRKDRERLQELDAGARRKAYALLWAYLGRFHMSDQTLDSEKFQTATTALALNDTFITIAKEFGLSGPLLAAYETSQCLIQAIPPNGPPLLQLPHFNRDAIAKIEESVALASSKHLTVQDFMAVPAARRKEIALAAGIGSPQYDMAIKVAQQLPRLVVEHAFFKVTGEKYVVPSSIVQYVIKARFIPPGCTDIPPVNPADLEDDDDEEEQVNTKAKATAEAERGNHQPPLTHAPYFARTHAPRWHLYMSWLPNLNLPNQHPSQLQYRIGVGPLTISTFNKPILTPEGKPTFAMQTLKVRTQAPGNAGQVRFQSHLVCDSYVGFDDHRMMILDIEDPARAVDVDSDDDISEPDEDTIAGQMAALRGEGGKSASSGHAKNKKKAVQEEDVSDESDTDDDIDDDTSETDTDTSDEEDN